MVVEDPDPDLLLLSCLDGPEDARELANRLRASFRSMLAARGGSLAFGRRLPGLMIGLGSPTSGPKPTSPSLMAPLITVWGRK